MITFNVSSVCVTRDALDILEKEDSRNKIKVLQYVAALHTVSAFSERNDHFFTDDDFKEYVGTKFLKRCTIQELNKTSLDYLFAKKSNYLIIDLLQNAYRIFKNGNRYISFNYMYMQNIGRFTNDLKLNEYENLQCHQITWETFEESLDKFCNSILSHYAPDEIILNEYFCATEYLEKNTIKPFDVDKLNITAKNDLMTKTYNYVENKLYGCHIIKTPDNVFADVDNPKGLHELHFHTLYYRYCSEAIKTICSRLSDSMEKEKLDELRQIYSERLELVKKRALLSQAENELKSKSNRLIWSNNALELCKKALLDSYGERCFQSNINKIKQKHMRIAILKRGSTWGKIITDILTHEGVEIIFSTEESDVNKLSAEDLEICSQADMVIIANSSFFKIVERDGVKAFPVHLLLSGSSLP